MHAVVPIEPSTLMSVVSAAPDPVVSVGDLAQEQRAVVKDVRTWRRFHHRVRKRGHTLLAALGAYPDSVLVAGCQRSGTTLLTRIIAGAQGFARFKFTHDDELDAALVLAGKLDIPAASRYCFQTTYLNERYREYARLGGGQKLVWMLRNPQSVVYSMVYHWKRFAMNELYASAIEDAPELLEKRTHRVPWPLGLHRIERACLSYAWKTSQIRAIRELVPPDRLLVVDYHDLVSQPHRVLETVFAFLHESYRPQYASVVRSDSLGKAERLTAAERSLVDNIALPVYEKCRALLSAY